MSIQAIDAISPQRSIDRWQDAYAYSNAQPQVSSQTAPMFQQLMTLLLQNLLSGAGQNPGNGTNGTNVTNGTGFPSDPVSTPGLGGPGSTQALGGAGGSDPLAGLMSSLFELLNALAPLLQALGGNGMKPNNAAGGLADQLGGGSGGSGASGMPWDSAPAAAPAPQTTPAPAPAPFSSAPTSPPASGSPVGSVKPTEIPPATGKVVVNEPIVVKAGETFDGGGKLYQAGPALGDGGQSETQKPVFILEPGATLTNVQVAGGDGVHTKGDATLKDVWWKDVGEDAMTMKGPGNVTVSGGGAYNATDKIFQINAGGSLSIDGFTADTFGKAVRTNGGKDFPITIDIKNSVFRNGDEAVVRTDATQAKIKLHPDVVVENVPNDVIAPSGSSVEGAKSLTYKPFSE